MSNSSGTSASPPGRRTGKVRRLIRWFGYGLASLLCVAGLIAAVGFTYETFASRQDRRLFPPPGQMVDVGGYRLHILCAGEGSPTVILDSGLGSSAPYWGLVVPAVARHTRVCTFDRAGYGWSDPGPEPRTTQRVATELHALLANARIPQPYVLAGWSFGGFTARMYAHLYPREVAGIVLVESAHEDQFVRYVPTIVAGVRKAGFNFEPVVRAFGGPEHAHTVVETTITRLNLLKSRLGQARWSRRQEQTGDFWAGYPAGTAQQLRFCELQHGYLRAVLGEQRAWEESVAEIRGVRDLGEVPLIVVSRAQDLKGPYPAWFPMEELERQWQGMQSDLLHLSTRSRQVFARPSDHLVPHRRPEVVTTSILELVELTRTANRGTPALP